MKIAYPNSFIQLHLDGLALCIKLMQSPILYLMGASRHKIVFYFVKPEQLAKATKG